MFRKSVALIMIVVCTLVCLPVSSLAAESDLQEDFDNGEMKLSTYLMYQKQGLYYNLCFFDAFLNGNSYYEEFTYDFSRFDSVNPERKFAHAFEISYQDGRVLMSEGDSFKFCVHNFYSGFYWGQFDENNFDSSRFTWLDISKYAGYFLYFYDFNGNSYLISKDMYEIAFSQDEAMITLQMKSDMYDFDVYRIKFFVTFNISSLYAPYYGPGWVDPESWIELYGSFFCTFGYENLFVEISSDDAVTTGLLTSIIDYIKQMWNSIKELPANIKTALSTLFDGLSSSISGFFESLKTKLTDLFSVFTEEQTTYAPIDEGELPSDYQAAEDEAFDAAGVGDLDANINSAFENADSVFSNNNAYAFISGSMEQIVFGNVKISGLVIFSLAMGLCVLVLGRKLNSSA